MNDIMLHGSPCMVVQSEFSYFQREEEEGWGLGGEMSHQPYLLSITIAYIHWNDVFSVIAQRLIQRWVVWCKLHKKQHMRAFFGKSVLKCHLT